MRISDSLRLLAQQQIASEPDPILQGLIGAWDFETTGVVDLVGSVNGTIKNSAALVTGADGNGIQLATATSDWIDFGNPSGYDQMSKISVIIDFYPTAAGGSGTSNVFGNFWAATGSHVWHIGWNSSRYFRARITDAVSEKDVIQTGTANALNQWYRVGLRWDGNGTPLKIRVGANEYTGNVNVGPMTTAGLGLQISMNPALSGGPLRLLPGIVDNALVWNRYLSDDEWDKMFDGNPTYDEL